MFWYSSSKRADLLRLCDLRIKKEGECVFYEIKISLLGKEFPGYTYVFLKAGLQVRMVLNLKQKPLIQAVDDFYGNERSQETTGFFYLKEIVEFESKVIERRRKLSLAELAHILAKELKATFYFVA